MIPTQHWVLGVLGLGLGLGLSSCSTYTPAPVDLARDTQEWLDLSQKLTSSSRSLKKKDMQQVGLLLNPELNAQRLSYAKSTSIAKFAGLWEDPSLGTELVRNLTENVTNYGIAPSISIPVTGVPSIAKDIAEQYKEADYWKMRATERNFLALVENNSIDLLLSQRKERLINQRIRALRTESAQIDKLADLGEVTLAEKQIAKQRLSDLITEQQSAEDSVLTARLALARELGLHPSLATKLRIIDYLPKGTPATIGAPRPDALLDSPDLKAAAADFQSSELELKMEIRKQYPELSLSPSFGEDDGEHEVGLGIEFNIPLWNRNREAIASSDGERAIKSHSYVTAWRKLLTDATAFAAQERLSIRHCRSESERITQLDKHLAAQEELHRLGELSISELSEMRHENFQRKLNYLEYLQALLKTQVSLKQLNPHHTF